MHEILFRGKQRDNDEWIEGYYAVQSNHACFAHELKYTHFIFKDICLDFNLGGLQEFEVIPETVGPYTGLTDKNGKKIFEGDIVRRFNGRGQEVMRYAVKWNTDCCMFVLMCEYTYLGEYDSDFTVFYGEDLEVVGNIHDNLDFMKDDEDFKK